MEVPEVTQVGRRTGRAELDEHAEGVHSAEIDVDLKRSERDREAVMADIRAKLSVLPAQVYEGDVSYDKATKALTVGKKTVLANLLAIIPGDIALAQPLKASISLDDAVKVSVKADGSKIVTLEDGAKMTVAADAELEFDGAFVGAGAVAAKGEEPEGEDEDFDDEDAEDEDFDDEDEESEDGDDEDEDFEDGDDEDADDEDEDDEDADDEDEDDEDEDDEDEDDEDEDEEGDDDDGEDW